MSAGALDVYFSSISMKKNRPGIELSVLCDSEKEKNLVKLIFQESTSIGIRIRNERRKTLKREIRQKEIQDLEQITFKISKLNNEIINVQPEYRDCKKNCGRK